MARPQLDSPYLRELEKRVLIYDGAMGTTIQRFNLTPEDFGGKSLEGCNDNLVLTRPDVIPGDPRVIPRGRLRRRRNLHLPKHTPPAR